MAARSTVRCDDRVAVATVLLFFSSAYVVNLGDHVVVFNTKDVVFTGKKWDQKLYRRHTG